MVLSAHDVSHDGLTSCLIQAEITNVGNGPSTDFTTRFGFLGHPGLEPGTLAYFRFRWPALAPNANATESDHVEGMQCTGIEVTTVMGEGPSGMAAFIKVDVAPLAAPQVEKQAILVD
ncbi:hypothetical protein DM806_03205 [Sphingobium lactosutens]|nr:hypothetical protein [Sphingobium lactosutens]